MMMRIGLVRCFPRTKSMVAGIVRPHNEIREFLIGLGKGCEMVDIVHRAQNKGILKECK